MLARPVHRLLLVAIAVLPALPCLGQESATALHILTNAQDATVFADGTPLGRARTGYFRIPPWTQEISLVASDRSSWSVPPIVVPSERWADRDTVSLRLDFPYYYRLESTPHAAFVRLVYGDGTRTLGHTPTTYKSTEPLKGTLEFGLDGFQKETRSAGADIWNLYVVELEPLDSSVRPVDLALSPPRQRREWIDYVAVGTALVAGGLAVHFKFKADRRFDRYQETGDPALRPAIKRYDVYSGVALGVMQAGLGLFAVRLVLR